VLTGKIRPNAMEEEEEEEGNEQKPQR